MKKVIFSGLVGIVTIGLTSAILISLGILPRCDRVDAIFSTNSRSRHATSTSRNTRFPSSFEWEGMKIEIGPAVVSEFVRITKGPPDKFLGSSLQESWSFLTIEGRTLQLRGPKLLLGEKELCSVRPGDSVAFRAEGVFHNDERLTDLSRSGE